VGLWTTWKSLRRRGFSRVVPSRRAAEFLRPGPSRLWRDVRPEASDSRIRRRSSAWPRGLWKRQRGGRVAAAVRGGLLSEVLQHAIERLCELGLALAQLVDLLHRVHHRRVVLVVELTTDVGVGEVGEALAHPHRDLAGKGDLLLVGL